MNLSRPDRAPRLDALAALYALGTLGGRARRRLARVAQTDTVVAAAIRAWDARLSPLAFGAAPITPPPRVWKGIVATLGLTQVDTASTETWWQGMAFWRGLAIAGFAGMIALSVALLSPQQDVSPPLIVVLAGPDAKPALIATMDRGTRQMRVKTVGGAPVPPGRALELWMLPEGAPPRSLGLIPASGAGFINLPAPAEIALARVPALAVSLEAAGGSTTGAPQGPVLYTGSVERMY